MTEYVRIPIREDEHKRLVALQTELIGKIDSYLSRPSLSDVIEYLLDQQEIKTMQKQMYSVKVNGDILYHDLFKNEAISIARREAEAGNQVFVTWFRKSDGQHGHLNSDGNHDITGTAW